MDPPEEEGAALLKPQVAVAFSLEVGESNKKKGRCGEGIRTSLRHMLLGTRVNMLLPFIPAAMAADAMNMGKAWTFSFTLLAIIPLAERLGFVTEQLAMHTNSTVGGLMNATFGNATEMIVAIFALNEGLLRVVQMSLLGSILSNMLLVLGSAFFLGGCVVRVQRFNQTAALVNAGLLLMALMGMLLPAVLYATHTELRDGTSELFLSRFSSVVMLIAYGAYLFFQLKSHRELYSEKPDVSHCSSRAVGGQVSERGAQLDALESGHLAALSGHVADLRPLDGHVEDLRSLNGHGEKDDRRQMPLPSHHGSDVSNRGATRNPILNPGVNPNCPLCCPHGKPLPNPDPYDVIGMAAASGDVSKEEEEEEESVLGFWGSVVWLALITVLIAVLSDRLVATLQGAAQALNVSVAFISVIVLPIVGNAAEHASAVLFAYRNRLDITLGVAIGSSTQIAMFVTPFCVVLGWVLGQPLDLNFHLFETATLFIAVLVVVFLLQDGTSNWLKGLLLVFCYLIIGASFFVHWDEIAPVRSTDDSGWPSPEH